MKIEKDVILAILIGVLVGAVAAFSILFLPKYLSPPSSSEIKKSSQEEIALSPTPSFSLAITSPQDEIISSKNKILVSGKTTSGALVAILSPVDEAAVEADEQGHFETEIFLEEGINEIKITAYQNEEEESQTITVFYTQEEI